MVKTFEVEGSRCMIAVFQSPRPITLNRRKFLRLSKAASTMSIPELLPYGITVFADGVDHVPTGAERL